jgi:tRNA(adenine34) deaminase
LKLVQLISKQRDKQIRSHAEPYLEDGEEVVYWARVRHPGAHRHGYAYLTDSRCLIHWTGRSDESASPKWGEMTSWGVDPHARGGPLLGVESAQEKAFVRLQATNLSAAERATTFLREFSLRAPRPTRTLHKENHEGQFEVFEGRSLIPPQRSPADLTKRILVTVLGVALIFVGAVITPLPGPWSLPIFLAGLALLATEYDWAEDILNWIREKYHRFRTRRSASRETP